MKTVAIIGASADRRKFGNKAVRVYQQKGWRVYPVNRHETSIEGLPVFASISDIPEEVERVCFYVPPAIGLKLIEDVARKKPKEVYFNPGSENTELLERASALGLTVRQACAIVALGESPNDYQ